MVGRVLLDGIVSDVTTINARYARLVVAVITAKSRGVAERLEALTLEQVLMTKAGLPMWDARRIIATAEVLVHMPRLLARFTAGQLAWATVAALARARRSRPPRPRQAAGGTGVSGQPRRHPHGPRWVLHRLADHGSFTGYLTFDALTGAPILEAIDAAGTTPTPTATGTATARPATPSPTRVPRR